MEFTVRTIKGDEPKCPACGVVNELYSTVTVKVLLPVHCVGLELAVGREEVEAKLAELGKCEYEAGKITCGACGTMFRRRPWTTCKELVNE